MSITTIKIRVKDCEKCKGSGKTEQCEYTPPFEKFIGQCPECKGSGKVQV